MERIRVKVRGGGYDGRLGHIVHFNNYGEAAVVLDTGELFPTQLMNLLAVDNVWQRRDWQRRDDWPSGGTEPTATTTMSWTPKDGAQPDA